MIVTVAAYILSVRDILLQLCRRLLASLMLRDLERISGLLMHPLWCGARIGVLRGRPLLKRGSMKLLFGRSTCRCLADVFIFH